ncbi:MAG TPA: alpha/beta fold hydrolase [Terrimesophilobacter sp.]|nr:alpha/beta fold hydrolase [Terrimesophilobacter sp.]
MAETRWAQLATGVRLPYEENGDPAAPACLFLHGYADTLRFFDPLLPYLPATMRVICLTQRGHGDAEKPPNGYALQDFADDVGAFLDFLNLTRVVLAGHSSGGYIAQRFAADWPDRVRGLCLIGAPFSLFHRTVPFAATVAALQDPVDADDVLSVMDAISATPDLPQRYLDDMVEESRKMPARVWRAALAGLSAADPPAAGPATITAPTLILGGDGDRILNSADPQLLQDAIPGSELIFVPDAGHLVAWDQPQQVGSMLRRWVQSLPADPASECLDPSVGRQYRRGMAARERPITVPLGQTRLTGDLTMPDAARGIVLFAHGAGSSRHSPRNRYVAAALADSGFATLLMDLLTPEEDAVDQRTGELRFDIGMLASRVTAATDWLHEEAETARLPLVLFGASTGAAAALVTAAARPNLVRAVISRGGRADLAGDALAAVSAPVLLIVGGNDPVVVGLNKQAAENLADCDLKVVPGVTHLFEEPGALDTVIDYARAALNRWLPGAAD